MTIKGKEECFIVKHINMTDMCLFHLNWSMQMKIGMFITLKIEKCHEALVVPLLPPRSVSFPETLPISTLYPWGLWGPTDSPLRVGLYCRVGVETL